MRRQLVPAIVSMVIFTVLLGLVYPAGRHGHRPGRVQAQGRRLPRRAERQGGRVEPDRAAVRRQEGQPDARSTSSRDRRPPVTTRPTAPARTSARSTRRSSPGACRCRRPTRTATRSSTRRATPSTRPTPTAPRCAIPTPCRSGPRPTASSTTSRKDVKIPVDAVTASGSGLDPDISVANAELQAPRVADARGAERGPGPEARRRAHRRPTARHHRGEDGQRPRPEPCARQAELMS